MVSIVATRFASSITHGSRREVVQGGRMVLLPTRNLSTPTSSITSLFQPKISSIPLSKTGSAQQARHQYTHTNAGSESESENNENEAEGGAKKKEPFKKLVKIFSGFSAGSVLGATALFIYEHPEKFKKWVDVRAQSKHDQLNDAFKDLVRANEILAEMKKLRELLGGNNSDEFIKNLIEKATVINNFNLEEKNKAITELEQKINNISNAKINELKLVINLYEQCPKEDSECLIDLHSFFLANTSMKFPAYHTFSPRFMDLLKQALQKNMNKFSILSLYGTYIKANTGLELLLEGLKENTTVQSLNLGWTDIEKKDIAAIASMLRVNQTLQKLDLSDNNIEEADVDTLLQALKESKIPRELNLNNTPIKKEKKAELNKKFNEGRNKSSQITIL